MEDHVVLAAVNHNLAFLGREPFPQSSRAFDRCEAAADDHDLRAVHDLPVRNDRAEQAIAWRFPNSMASGIAEYREHY
jgi:hypothetical protein